MTPTTHDASKVLMGVVFSSDRTLTAEPSDPASFPAGRAVRRKNDGALSLSSSDGSLVGVSAGKSLSDTAKTAVVRAGNQVPLELTGYAYLVKGDLTFYKKTAAVVSIETLDTGSQGAEEATVTGDADAGWLISVSIESTVSTATQVKAAIDASEEAAALLETVISGTAGTAQTAFAEDEVDGAPAAIGAAVRVSNSTGKAVVSGGTLTGAFYASALKTGVNEDSSEIPAALIDMAGGL